MEHIDDVIDAIRSIIDWSIQSESPIGYFAAMYLKVTLAVRDAIQRGSNTGARLADSEDRGVVVSDVAFDDPPRMERFLVAFASRYFDAINGHFHPDRHPAPTQVWRIAFEEDDEDPPIILQRLLIAMNAHIGLDLGITAAKIGGGSMQNLHNDFNKVNAIIANQVPDVMTAIQRCSPVLGTFKDELRETEVRIVTGALQVFRGVAWNFARLLALDPARGDAETIQDQDSLCAEQSEWYLNPGVPLDLIIDEIRDKESPNTARNIEELQGLAAGAEGEGEAEGFAPHVEGFAARLEGPTPPLELLPEFLY